MTLIDDILRGIALDTHKHRFGSFGLGSVCVFGVSGYLPRHDSSRCLTYARIMQAVKSVAIDESKGFFNSATSRGSLCIRKRHVLDSVCSVLVVGFF